MRLDAFYQDMKDAMNYLGVSWGDMHLIEISMRDGWVVLSYGGRECTILVPKKS